MQKTSNVQPRAVRPALRALALLTLATGLAACNGARGPLNVLLVTVDSLRADRVGPGSEVETPSIDTLLARGTRFSTAYTPMPEAVAALASVHTGLYPVAHGIRVPQDGGLDEKMTTVAEVLKSKGYRTGAFVGSVSLHPKYGLDQGFDLYGASFIKAPRPSTIPEAGLAAARVAEPALEFLESVREEPFFLWVNFHDPHYFYDPPEPFAGRYPDSPYDGEIANVDQELGHILERLRDYGLEDRTIVILAGTNGEGLGENGEDYHGTTLQAATTRVPLVVVGPGFGAGRTEDGPVSLVDVGPTILAMAGAPPLPGIDGLSLTEAPDPARPIYMETMMPHALFGWAPLVGVVSGPWKYVSRPSPVLFNLEADAGEHEDRSAAETEVAGKLSALVSEYSSRASHPAPPADAIEKITSLGYSTEAPEREPIDPYDQVEVANDALRAARSIRRGQIRTTQFLLDSVLSADPDNYTGLMTAVQIAVTAHDLDEQQRLLEMVRDLYPLDAEVYHQFGHLVLAQQGAEGAERGNTLLEIAASLDPKNEEALYDVACWYSVQGRTVDALEMLERAVDEGFRDFAWMRHDTDLDNIRLDPRFEAITGLKAAEEPAGNDQASP